MQETRRDREHTVIPVEIDEAQDPSCERQGERCEGKHDALREKRDDTSLIAVVRCLAVAATAYRVGRPFLVPMEETVQLGACRKDRERKNEGCGERRDRLRQKGYPCLAPAEHSGPNNPDIAAFVNTAVHKSAGANEMPALMPC